MDISLCQSTLKDLSLYCELNDAQSNKIRKCADKILQKATRQTKLQLVNTIASFAIFPNIFVGAKRKMKNKCICLYSVILSPSIILVSRILFSIKYLVKKHYLISFSISKCESQVALKILSLNIMCLHIIYVY